MIALLSGSYKNRRETWDSYDNVGVSSSDGSVVFQISVHSTPTSRTSRRSVDLFIDNLRRFTVGDPLTGVTQDELAG